MSLLRVFALTAILECFSWIFLLGSMIFAYIVETSWGEGAISVFGLIHGYLVIVYVAVLVVTLIRHRLGWMTILLDWLALFVPGLGFWVVKVALDEDRKRRRERAASLESSTAG